LRERARQLLSQAYLAGLRLPDVEKMLKDADRELTGGAAARKFNDNGEKVKQ